MKAARWYKAKDIRIDDIQEPTPSAGEVKIKVAFTGICGSDLHNYNAGPIGIPVGVPHPLTGALAPVISNEFSGTVTEVGEGVTRVRPGDRVVVEPLVVCGHCVACRQGRYNLCTLRAFHGASSGEGAFASYTIVKERMAHRMPDGMSFEQGALVEPAAVALYAVRSSSLKAGDKIAVFGAGAIGLMVVEAARLAGAEQIHVVELSPHRAARALELGADTIIDPSKEDAVARILELTEGGADVAFEITGAPPVLQQSVDATRSGGETVIVAIFENKVTFDPNAVVRAERTIKGIIAYRDMFPMTMKLMMNGHFQASKLVTKTIALESLVEEGFEELTRDKKHIKILVQPPG